MLRKRMEIRCYFGFVWANGTPASRFIADGCFGLRRRRSVSQRKNRLDLVVGEHVPALSHFRSILARLVPKGGEGLFLDTVEEFRRVTLVVGLGEGHAVIADNVGGGVSPGGGGVSSSEEDIADGCGGGVSSEGFAADPDVKGFEFRPVHHRKIQGPEAEGQQPVVDPAFPVLRVHRSVDAADLGHDADRRPRCQIAGDRIDPVGSSPSNVDGSEPRTVVVVGRRSTGGFVLTRRRDALGDGTEPRWVARPLRVFPSNHAVARDAPKPQQRHDGLFEGVEIRRERRWIVAERVLRRFLVARDARFLLVVSQVDEGRAGRVVHQFPDDGVHERGIRRVVELHRHVPPVLADEIRTLHVETR
mmetsp:Transcript_9129/g.22371  ORF Transcript_9129/g.22371 Transcript_9129/m.22371 type:complete len:360 (-) Transcript_9129:2709-3788(-)